MDLANIFKFVEFTHQFQQVKRVILVNSEDRLENDAEHSFQLALTAWYLITSKNLKLDLEKVLKYALVHDLVEVYAGDTFFHTEDQKLRQNKKKREFEAALKIKKNFPEMPDFFIEIEEYEKLNNYEAKFVYALDKVIPVINIYLDHGRSWQKEGVTYKMIRTKDEKVKVSEEIEKLWKELVIFLDRDREMLFK